MSQDRPFQIRLPRNEPLPRRGTAHAELDRALLVEALRRSGGNISEAGRYLGLSASTTYDLARRHGLVAKEQGGSNG